MDENEVLSQRRRRRPSAVRTILFLNVLVYLAWILLRENGEESPFMIDHFLVSWTGLTEGRVWILLTSVFSHNMFFHIFMNLYVLSGFGPIVELTIGTGRFVRFYLTAGIISSLSHALVSTLILGEPGIQALGASGAISGVVLLFSLMFPREKVLLLGIIPMPAMWGALLLVGLDIWGLVAQAEGGGLPVGHGAHLGGAFTGLVYFFMLKREVERRRRDLSDF